MASQNLITSAVLAVLLCSLDVLALTCPGFPGYCSESFPGQTCVVVCSKGRNNVPLCQEDGTWTDIPRCIEHDPGVPNQIPGVCPGISGYCSDGYVNERCNFACSVGAPINSVCSQDGTWTPYPTCAGDLRETQDGCVSCPGPNGRPRNRTAEAILGLTLHNPVPASSASKAPDSQGRVVRPTFSGNQAFGAINQPQQQQQQSFVPNLEAAGLRQEQQQQRQPPPKPSQTPVFIESSPEQPQIPPQQQQLTPQQRQQFIQQQQQQQLTPQQQQQFAQQQQQQQLTPQQQQQFAQQQQQEQLTPQQRQQFVQQQQQQQLTPQQQQQFAQQQQQQFGPPQGARQPTGFSPEQQSIIQKFSAQVTGFPFQQQQVQQPPQVQEPRQLPPPSFPSAQGTPTPRGPRPDLAFPRQEQDRFGPFEVVQPAEENSVDTGPLHAFPAIPGGAGPQEPLKARERPSAFGPFQLVDL